MAIDRYVVALLTATACVMVMEACMPTERAKPLSYTVARIPSDNLQDSLQHAAMEADRKASIDRFKEQRRVKP